MHIHGTNQLFLNFQVQPQHKTQNTKQKKERGKKKEEKRKKNLEHAIMSRKHVTKRKKK